eukprot:s2167_g16.t1
MEEEENQPEEELALDSLVTVAEDLEPYVLSWPSQTEADGVSEALVLVVAKRSGGFLLAVPLDFLPSGVLQRANEGHEAGPVGASTVLVLPSVIVDGGVRSPTGTMVSVVVVDVAEDLLSRLRLASEVEDIAMPFDLDSPFALPDPVQLLSRAMEWVRAAEDETGLAFYSAVEAEEVPESAEERQEEVPHLPKQRARPKRQPAGRGTPTGDGGGPKPKRVTNASLAASMDQLLELVPSLSNQLQNLAQRQDALESRVAAPTRAGTLGLSQPLSSSLAPRPVAPGIVARAIATPPPRTNPKTPNVFLPPQDCQPPELLALEEDKPGEAIGGGTDLARAVLAQSQALSALVGQIAQTHQDPLMDLGSSGSSASTRGSLGRAKLQAELATHSGGFYLNVLRAMARRMQPTSAATGTPAELMQRGICGTLYMERFGGFGKHRDLGMILYQIMTCMDFLQTDNIGAARDSLALLAVCLDQAVLDNGKFDLAALLTLQEEPPSAIFLNRHQSTLSRSRAFSQLADQRWVTVSLAYLNEMDLITTKRQELNMGPQSNAKGSNDPAPSAKAKRQAKRKAKGGGKGTAGGGQEGEEE